MITEKNQLRAIKLLIFTKKTKKEIAQEVGITEQTLYNWLKNEEFSYYLKLEYEIYRDYIRKQIFKKLNSLLMESLKVIENGLESKDEKIRINCAFQILKSYSLYGNLDILGFNYNELSHIKYDIELIKSILATPEDKKEGELALNLIKSDKALNELLDYEELIESDEKVIEESEEVKIEDL